jgi:predicted Zn-dependent protease
MRLGLGLSMLVGAVLSVSAHAALTPEEQRGRIDLEVRQFEEALSHSGDLFADPELDAYLQTTLDRLFPDLEGRLRVRSFSDSDFNAFALPSGGIYFHTGALLRIVDEAQLASVLGHEGIHVTADHTYKRVVQGKQQMGVLSVTIFINPLLASVMAVSSMAGFSREHEREADLGGFERMASAGYDPRAGSELFERMDRELLARKLPRGMYFYASHPRIKERADSFRELAAARPEGGERATDRYRAVTARARMHAVSQIHRRGDGKLLVFLLGEENLLATLPPEATYYLAEGYRLRNQPGDAALSSAQYARALEVAPAFAPTHQAIGLEHLRAGRRVEALAAFEKYLELEPDGARGAYVRQYIANLKKELGQ